MPLANLITPKKINVLGVSLSVILIAFFLPAYSQDNSPYTRYGLGDIVPSTNISSRGLGSISAGYNDLLTINYSNPASYGFFQAIRENKSKKLAYGRAILDLGLNFENRTLTEPANTEKFTASNALFSHLQVGVPLRQNWGLVFGLRPMTRISYKMANYQRLHDPVTGEPIDSVVTLSEGDGGSYLASAGVGHRFALTGRQSLALGVNVGYLFGKKDYSTRLSFINDTVAYQSGNFQTRTTYGNIYINGGLQYQLQLDSVTLLTFGAYGNLRQKLNASQDVIRETYFYSESAGNVRIDSVYENTGRKGKIEYPSSFTAGFALQRIPTLKKSGYLIGVDFSQAKWDDYRFFGQVDSVADNWSVHVGGELRPSLGAARKSYFGNVAYRAGFSIGPDYIRIKDKLPGWGASFGLGLPLMSENRFSPGQVTMVNVAFEYMRRGNSDNLLKENMFRISVGFSLSDFWFVRRKYE